MSFFLEKGVKARDLKHLDSLRNLSANKTVSKSDIKRTDKTHKHHDMKWWKSETFADQFNICWVDDKQSPPVSCQHSLWLWLFHPSCLMLMLGIKRSISGKKRKLDAIAVMNLDENSHDRKLLNLQTHPWVIGWWWYSDAAKICWMTTSKMSIMKWHFIIPWNARKYNASLGKKIMFSWVFALFRKVNLLLAECFDHPSRDSWIHQKSPCLSKKISVRVHTCPLERQEWILVLAVQRWPRGRKIENVHCYTTDTYLSFVDEPTSRCQAWNKLWWTKPHGRANKFFPQNLFPRKVSGCEGIQGYQQCYGPTPKCFKEQAESPCGMFTREQLFFRISTCLKMMFGRWFIRIRARVVLKTMIQRRWVPFFKRQNLSSCKRNFFSYPQRFGREKKHHFFLVVLVVNPRTKSPCLAWIIFVNWIWHPKRKRLRRRRICMWSTSKKWLRWLTTWPGREGTSAVLCLFVGWLLLLLLSLPLLWAFALPFSFILKRSSSSFSTFPTSPIFGVG